MSRDKRSAAATLDAFFAGVDELRAHLDRRIQDPAHRHARLGRLATQMLEHRDPSTLAHWLVCGVREAVGAEGAALYLRDPLETSEAAVVASAGPLDKPPPPPSARDVRAVGPRTLWLPLVGAEGPVGGLWLSGVVPLDELSLELLEAAVGSAAMTLEQAQRLHALSRDPVTGLPNEASFLGAAKRTLSRRTHAGRATVLLLLGVAGVEALRAARGPQASRRAIQALGRAVRDCVGPGALLGTHFDDVLVLLDDVALGEVDDLGWRFVQRLETLLAQVQPGVACTAVVATVTGKSDLASLIERAAELGHQGRAGGVSQVH